MRIKRLEYHDRARGWKLEPVEFSNLNLLVGVSGAGKTQILNAILDLKNIATKGISLGGREWNITCLSDQGIEFCWQGEFENLDSSKGQDEIKELYSQVDGQPRIVYERLVSHGNIIAERNVEDGISLKGEKVPRLSSYQSILSTLKEEEDIMPIQDFFWRIFFNSQSDFNPLLYKFFWKEKEPLLKLGKLRDVGLYHLPIQFTLFLVYQYEVDLFNKIIEHFKEVFPQVEDVKLEKDIESSSNDRAFALLLLKEKGIDRWISQRNISSGMFKTFLNLAELYLAPHGSVILIDEFENSLGVNCIDAVTDSLLTIRQDLQFIITSHHPYIINNIPMDCWKIVTRKGGVVTVKSAEDLHLGRSKHQAYLQLINKLERYNEELESA